MTQECEACGHEHQGAELAYICIGCPCPAEPGRGAYTEALEREAERVAQAEAVELKALREEVLRLREAIASGDFNEVYAAGLSLGQRLTRESVELARYREREPLVQKLLATWPLYTGQEMYGEAIRESMSMQDFREWDQAWAAVRDFRVGP